MEYKFRDIEKKWQDWWKENQSYKVPNVSDKPKYYVLDMFPYPSGAGLHVGHPLGYIASDIFSRFKRLKGFNVLHPMGYDAFGLPAEQYAIEHGVHPAVSTEQNINNFRKQLDNIGFCFDWDREVRTSDPSYYKWTQWIFLQLFNSFYNRQTNKAENIGSLINIFEESGSSTPVIRPQAIQFSAAEWNSFNEARQQSILMDHRLAYCGYGEVNWCEALGTVLANDEVVNGVSERGGHPVVKKKLRQWYLRITEYADRLLEGLERIDFSESMKEMQTNWIGKSSGAEIEFEVRSGESDTGSRLRVYTTRPDTIFGADFMVIAPEHELIQKITTAEQQQAVEQYLTYVKSRSERERMAEKKISGVLTGAYALNPFDQREIPIWISEYVLAGYGTGAIMAVPCGDERDHKFAQHFNIPITNIIGRYYDGVESNATKEAILENSGFLNGMVMRDAMEVVITKIEELGIGVRKINYKMRDAAFSRQRYWGEPFPIVWKNGVAYPLQESELPLELPKVDSYSPGPEGEGPLANIREWVLIPSPSPQAEKGAVGAAAVPKYSVHTPMQFELAKEMRKGHTKAEGMLWELLRNSMLGEKFRRQHPIEAYIVDFICLQKRLIVEVDGGYHESDEQKLYDAQRTKTLEQIGFEIIRFTNEEVEKDVYAVRDKIKLKLKESPNDSPLRQRRGVGGEGTPTGMRETNTMPGYAGSSWYFLRYMDPHNEEVFCDRKVSDYWGQVDLYIGGTEHAVGHLLYSRMWTKALFDLGYIGHDEPYKKLVNQGMITGKSYFFKIFMAEGEDKTYAISENKMPSDYGFGNGTILYERLRYAHKYIESGGKLTKEKFEQYCKDFKGFTFGFEIMFNEDEYIILKEEIEKMSKSKFNVDNPDEIVEKYGADTFRMYEMFLGPVEISKPWDTKGIEGVHRFLKKLWRLFYDEIKGKVWTDEKATADELKVLHKTIKKIEEDTERFSFNTAVSAFMICVNELSDLKCHKKEILQPLLILLSPYAPHLAEELYQLLGVAIASHTGGERVWAGSALDATFPVFEAKYIMESTKEYPVSVNGKLRTTIDLPLDMQQPEVEQVVLNNEVIKKWLEGKAPKKIIFVKGKMVNVVI